MKLKEYFTEDDGRIEEGFSFHIEKIWDNFLELLELEIEL